MQMPSVEITLGKKLLQQFTIIDEENKPGGNYVRLLQAERRKRKIIEDIRKLEEEHVSQED